MAGESGAPGGPLRPHLSLGQKDDTGCGLPHRKTDLVIRELR